MIADAILRYVIVAVVVGVLSSVATYRLTSASQTSKELKQTNSAIIKKDKIDTAVNTIVAKHEDIKQQQEVIKEKTRVIYETIVKTETVYRDSACSLTPSGVQLLDSTADQLNRTRITDGALPEITNF